MLVNSFIVLAALLPALASSRSNPPHLRHRKAASHFKAQRSEGQTDGKALAARANEAHAEAHRVIKRTVNKRGQTCRPRGVKAADAISSAAAAASSSAVVSDAPAPSSSIENQQAWAHKSSSTTQWTAPSSTTDWQSPATSSAAPTSGSGGGGSSSWGLLNINDPTCGWSNANSDQPNGSQDWLNCGINGGGWTPPMVTADQLIAQEIDTGGIFSPCASYIDKFHQYGNAHNVPAIMLASFAMQESTCNPGATGGNGEAGMMQIAQINCEAGNNCWDLDYNMNRGAQLFRQMIDANGGNVLAAIGSYNGYRIGLTYADATRAKNEGHCFAQNNLDYLYQFCNGWMQNKNAHSMGTYFNLAGC